MSFEQPRFNKPETEKIGEIKEEKIESFKLLQEGEETYSKEFEGKLDEILEHEFKVKKEDGQEESIVLKKIVDEHLEKFSSPDFSNLSKEEKTGKQIEFVKDLGRGINSIPSGGDPWSFYFGRIMEKGKINCSGSTALTGMILENTKEKTGIKNIEYGMPFGHAVNMITFENNQLYWADARNGVIENISDYTKTENKDGLKIYKINQPSEKTGDQIPYRIVPVTSIKEGTAISYLENLHSAYNASKGKFDSALKMGYSKEELKEIQKLAKDVCQEKGLMSPKQFHRLRETKSFFNDKMDKYNQSEEFKEEAKRIEKIIEK